MADRLSGGVSGGVGFGGFRARMAPMMLLADSFEDPEHARIIYLAAGGLVLIAVLIIVGTVWWWRSAAVEHPSLGPLEVMGTKSWWKGDHNSRRDALDAVRPDGSGLGDDALIVPDPVDLLEADRTRPLDFDDLLDPELDDEDWRSERTVVDRSAADRTIIERKVPDRKVEPKLAKRAPRVPMDPLLQRKSDDY